MPKIEVNFEEAGRRMRERIAQALADLENIRETLTQIGLPDEDPETGVATHELAEGLNHVGALESLMRDQLSRNREAHMGRRPGSTD